MKKGFETRNYFHVGLRMKMKNNAVKNKLCRFSDLPYKNIDDLSNLKGCS